MKQYIVGLTPSCAIATVFMAQLMIPVCGNESPKVETVSPSFERTVIDPKVENEIHKPKVFAKFSKDGFNDLGSLDNDGFKLYRYSRNWKAYTIFQPGEAGGFEDAAVADVNGDGWPDVILGGWSNQTIWAENPAGSGKDPYTTPWKIHVVDSGRFSHEVCAADLNHNGKSDIITTSGIYLQGSTPDTWTFVDIGRSAQGTCVGTILTNHDGYKDVIATVQRNGKNQIAWFENPSHTHGNPAVGPWIVHIIDPDPGGDVDNREMTCMAYTLHDINGDGRPDLVAASMGEGPDDGADPRQVGDGLVWYEAPANPRIGAWKRHVIDSAAAWVHATSIQVADFDGDGHPDVCYAEQDQSSNRKDGKPGRVLGICYNVAGNGTVWKSQILSRYPDYGAGGFNSRVGIIGHDKLPSILTSLHGFFGDPNPLILWRNRGVQK